MDNQNKGITKVLLEKNNQYQSEYLDVFSYHVNGQSPKIAVLTCADSRVIPEFIFHATIGELFVVRIAGNIAVGRTVLSSLEYAVNHLKISQLIILGHTHCGAIKAAESSPDDTSLLIQEITKSFDLNQKDHVRANLTRQLTMLPKRSKVISDAISDGSLKLLGAIYHLKDGHVEFI